MGPDSNSLHRITLQLPVPTHDSKTLLKLLQLKLQAHPPGAPVKKVSLAIEAVRPPKTQGKLFIPPGPEPQRLEVTLARIKAIAGETRVGSPVLRNTHQPDAFQVRWFSLSEETSGARTSRPRLAAESNKEMNATTRGRTSGSHSQYTAVPHSALRRFRPAIPARIELKDAMPAFVTFLNQRRKVLAWAGPWCSSGDWWNESSWARDEWDVTLVESINPVHKACPVKPVSAPEAAIYRIFLDLHRQQWFVEGVYD